MASRAGVARFGDGQSTLDQRIGQQGDVIVSELHARYYEQAVRRNVFFSHSKVRATSLGATAQIGHILWNPPDSGVNLVLLKWASMVSVTSATTTGFCLGFSYQSTTPTAVTVSDVSGSTFALMSGATLTVFPQGKVKAYSIATLLNAPTDGPLLHHNTAAINATGVENMSGDFEGIIVIPPGGILTINALGTAAAAAAHTSSLFWEEVPVI